MFPALIRVLAVAWLLALPVPELWAAEMVAHPFVAGAATLDGPGAARGAVVWLHGSYDPASEARPDDPAWLGAVRGRGYDVWHYNRAVRPDPLADGAAGLIEGLTALRRAGYRRVVVAGFSRGAFIGLAALARPDLADAVLAVSPAAHGRRVERRGEALAAFAERMTAGLAVRLGLVILRDDAWDPGPAQRAAMAQGSAAGRAGLLLLVDRPEGLSDHMGSFTPEFAARFGACLAAFADAAAGGDACAGR